MDWGGADKDERTSLSLWRNGMKTQVHFDAKEISDLQFFHNVYFSRTFYRIHALRKKLHKKNPYFQVPSVPSYVREKPEHPSTFVIQVVECLIRF